MLVLFEQPYVKGLCALIPVMFEMIFSASGRDVSGISLVLVLEMFEMIINASGRNFLGRSLVFVSVMSR